jgi:hypothetical protein
MMGGDGNCFFKNDGEVCHLIASLFLIYCVFTSGASSAEWVQPTAERGGFPLCYVCFVFFCLLACFLRFGHVCFFMRLNLST